MDIRKRFQAAVVLCVAPLPIVFLIYAEEIFTKKSYYITVMENDAATECRHRRSKFQGGRYRSSLPKYAVLHYCGVILTESSGHFKLPPSNDYLKFHKGRSFLVQNLKPGCNYKVLTIGFGDEPILYGRPRVPVQKTIIEIEEKLECG